MPDYSKSKIYSLMCGEMIYIGATTYKLSLRKGRHKRDYLSSKGKCMSKLLYKYAEENGLSLTEDIRIELVCECPCDNKEQLDKIEGEYIRQFKSEYGEKCVNKYITGRTKQEYNNENRDKIKEYKKEYYENNKDKLSQKNKEYYEVNKSKLLEYKKEYYENNKEKIQEYKKEKIVCECGSIINRVELSKHKKSRKHIIRINE
jgi:hypothetical protein